MTYSYYDPTLPKIQSDASQVWSESRINTNALVDAVNMASMENWNAVPTGANPSQPDQYLITNVTDPKQKLKMTFTWGTSGVSEGAPTQIVFEKTTDGVNYDVINTATFAYTVLGAAPSVTWSRPA